MFKVKRHTGMSHSAVFVDDLECGRASKLVASHGEGFERAQAPERLSRNCAWDGNSRISLG